MPRKTQNIEPNQKTLIPFKEYRMEEFCAKATQQLCQTTDKKTTPSKQQTLLIALIKPVEGLFAYISGVNTKLYVQILKILGLKGIFPDLTRGFPDRARGLLGLTIGLFDLTRGLLDQASGLFGLTRGLLSLTRGLLGLTIGLLGRAIGLLGLTIGFLDLTRGLLGQARGLLGLTIGLKGLQKINFIVSKTELYHSRYLLLLSKYWFFLIIKNFRQFALFWNFTMAGPEFKGSIYSPQKQ